MRFRHVIGKKSKAKSGGTAQLPPKTTEKHGTLEAPYRFHQDPIAAERAFFVFNDDTPESRANFCPAMIHRAVEFDYLNWPRRISMEVRGRDVLDVGCGTGLHAVGFLVVGVRSYTGLDPKIKLDDDRSKNLRRKNKEHFGWTPRQMMQRLPRVSLIPGTFEQVAPGKTFDIAVLHNVTEHLMNIEEVFRGVWERLTPAGRIIFHHHNFYCWNGHHQAPKTIAAINTNDATQRLYMDWAHLSPTTEAAEWMSTRVNRIRLDEIRALTDKYFHVEEWEERLSEPQEGAERLTDAIRAALPQYTTRDLLTQGVYCTANRREQPAS
jgi:SAM-dependent methyltransferase